MALRNKIRKFFFPSVTPKFIIRASLVALGAYILFGHICTPMHIKGYSMEPTYHNGGVNFCWRLRYLFSEPKKGDVAMVRLAGNKVVLLKRIVAVEGEQVEFRGGKLFVDGEQIDEPYVRYPCDWDLSPRVVEQDHVYVVGDNRSTPMERHAFGQTSLTRIIGAPLW